MRDFVNLTCYFTNEVRIFPVSWIKEVMSDPSQEYRVVAYLRECDDRMTVIKVNESLAILESALGFLTAGDALDL